MWPPFTRSSSASRRRQPLDAYRLNNAPAFARVDGASLVSLRQSDFQDDFGMREPDALYLYGAIANLWMNLKW